MNLDFMEEKRKEKRLSVAEFCDSIGVDKSTYFRWKSNPDGMKLSTANRIADVLELKQRERLKFLT